MDWKVFYGNSEGIWCETENNYTQAENIRPKMKKYIQINGNSRMLIVAVFWFGLYFGSLDSISFPLDSICSDLDSISSIPDRIAN